MNISEIIDEIRLLPEEDIIKFKDEFTKFYRPYEMKLEREKQQFLKEKAYKDGDKICELYGVNLYPFSKIIKSEDCPYEAFEYNEPLCEDSIIGEYYAKISDNDFNKIKELELSLLQYFNRLGEAKDGMDLYPGETLYRCFIKGTHEVIDFKDYEISDEISKI